MLAKSRHTVGAQVNAATVVLTDELTVPVEPSLSRVLPVSRPVSVHFQKKRSGCCKVKCLVASPPLVRQCDYNPLLPSAQHGLVHPGLAYTRKPTMTKQAVLF